MYLAYALLRDTSVPILRRLYHQCTSRKPPSCLGSFAVSNCRRCSSLDTAGTEQFGTWETKDIPALSSPESNIRLVAMRDLYMKTGQGFMLVFSITSKTSLGELATLREEIIRIKDDASIPIVMVGNKADLEDLRQVERAKAFSISQRWGAPYYEASARTRSRLLTSCPRRGSDALTRVC